MADEKKRPPVARGKAQQWTDKELDEFCSAEALEERAEQAAADWRNNAPREYSGLLDAERKTE